MCVCVCVCGGGGGCLLFMLRGFNVYMLSFTHLLIVPIVVRVRLIA